MALVARRTPRPSRPAPKPPSDDLRRLLEAGLEARATGDLQSALARFRSAVADAPDDPNALHLLGALLLETGDAGAALAPLRKAGGIVEHPVILTSLAAAERAAGNLEPARAAMRRAVDIVPGDGGLKLRLARLCIELGDNDEAGQVLDGLAHEPVADPSLMADIAKAHLLLDRPADARAWAERARDINPTAPGVLDTLGLAELELGRGGDALRHLQAAIAARPDAPEPWINLGMALAVSGRFADAVPPLERAVTLAPDNADARFNRGLVRLAMGDDAGGWPDYAWRFRTGGFLRHRAARASEWDGAALAGGTLVIEGEQGLGDQIMFASCLPDAVAAAGDGAGIVVACDERLVPLLARSFPAVRFTGAPADTLDADARIAIGDLPRLFRRSAGAYPDRRSFLVADPDETAAWRRRLAEIGPGPIVGFAWRGGWQSLMRRRKTPPIEAWQPLLTVPGVRFVSLQYGDVAADLSGFEAAGCPPPLRFPDLDPTRNPDVQAALIAALDLVVQVSNTSAHLAGALGRPVWNLVPAGHDFRWRPGRETPWYPSMRLYRQNDATDWAGPIQAAAGDLAAWRAER